MFSTISLGLPLSDHLATGQNISPVASAKRFTDIMFGDQNTDATFSKVHDNLLDVDDGDGVNAGKRFIQQDKVRITSERSRNLNTSSFATR